MLSKRDVQFGRGRPVAPDTFIRGSDAKAHPHYYCDLARLAALFAGCALLSLAQEGRRAGARQWHILAERGRACECASGRAAYDGSRLAQNFNPRSRANICYR